MKHSTESILKRAEESEVGLYDALNLAYNLHYELSPESNDKEFADLSFAILAARNAAKMGVPSPVPMPAGWIYTPSDNKTDDPSLSERAKELIKLQRARLAPEKPYADIIQEVALSELEMALLLLGKQYYWFADPLALREVRLGLQERINEYTLSGNANDKHVKSPRLQYAVTWLKSYEKQLIKFLEEGGKALLRKTRSITAASRLASLALDEEYDHLAYSITAASRAASLALDKGCPQDGDTLDTAPPAAAAVWASLLCKNVKYTLENLDGLLVSLTLLTDAASRTPTPDFKGSAVLGAVKALRERRYLRTANNAKLARLLAERYGTDAANPHTVKRGTDQLPEPATPVYTRALALLPAP